MVHKKISNRIISLVLCFVCSEAAVAADCGSGDEFAATRWDKYVELAQRFGCAPPNTNDVSAVVAACKADPLATARINAGLVRDFNHAKYVQNLIKHPNRLTLAPRSGKIQGLLNKTWVYPELWDEDSVNLRFRKVLGNNRVKVELCRHQPDGRSIPLIDEVVRGSAPPGTTVNQTLSGVVDSFITVTINGREPTLDETDYQIHIERPDQGAPHVPQRSGQRDVSGYADLHTHMMSYFGFGGGFVESSPFHPLEDCDGRHGALHGAFASGDFEKEHLNRTRARADWPHHLDTAHQQMGLNQLKQAHNHGLSLLVMTAVSNEWASEILIKGSSKDPDVPRNDMDSVRLQLRAAHAYAAENDWFRIARDPWEARRIIADGDLAVILGVEISNLFPANQGAWEQQLDELYDLGVRQMGLAHETDTQFAGVARHHGLTLRVANYLKNLGPLGIFDLSPLSPQNFQEAYNNFFTGPNPVGLKPVGRDLLSELAQKRMLIDIDHISREARSVAIWHARNELNGYPLIFTHTRYDDLMPTFNEVSNLAGYEVSEKSARAYGGFTGGTHSKGTGEYMATLVEILGVMKSGGIVGLRSGPNAIRTMTTPDPTAPNSRIDAGIPNGCPASAEGFAQLVAFGNRRLGVAQVMGSDIASPFVAQLGPRSAASDMNATLACAGYTNTNPPPDGNGQVETVVPNSVADLTPGGTVMDLQDSQLLAGSDLGRWSDIQAEFDIEGMKHIGMMPALLNDVQSMGVNIDPMLRSAENVLRVWERAWDDNRQEVDLGEYWAMMEMPIPTDFVTPLPVSTWETNKLNDNATSFGAWDAASRGTLPWKYARFADFNGDGRADVFRRTADGRWLLMLIQPDGDYSGEWIKISDAQRTPLARLHIADFDGDGRADVFRRTRNGRWQIRFSSDLLGSIPATATESTHVVRRPAVTLGRWRNVGRDASSQMGDLRFADFNGDGRTDVLRKLPNENFLSIRYMGDSEFGNWVTAGQFTGRLNRLRFADFSGDGSADLLHVPATATGDVVMRVKQGNQFQNANTVSLSRELARLRFADFNGDGRADSFHRRANGGWRIKIMGTQDFGGWRNVGSAASTVLADMAFADFDGDGSTDVIRRN